TSVFVTIELLNHTTLLSILPKKVALAYAELNKVALAPQGDLESNYPVGIMYRAEALSNPIINLVLETVRAMSGPIAADHPPA
ncbi:MAG: hypothetical protein H5U29_14760, partial [Pusillimonas sp.]|nr:hypothetical protein [Pusillimonas sp.]